ncbi:hypothetical protein N7G274_009743 [Stereocaulon virgatum]|uniref:Uncharacterized protein n=1 Tax=Stereocaulon virgatum TaxID=373712 RepID=A0ABR4A2A6_9LECA
MTTSNSSSLHLGPPTATSHIRDYTKVPPGSLTPKEADKYEILYNRADRIDHFLDAYRNDKGNLPGKKKRDDAKAILDKWNMQHGLDEGFRTYKDLECLKSTTSHAKLDLRKLLGLVKVSAKRSTKTPAKKITVTAKKALVVKFKGVSINAEGKASGRS